MKTTIQDFIRRNTILTLLGGGLLLISACNEVDDVGGDVTTEETEAGSTCDLDKHKLQVTTAYLTSNNFPLLQNKTYLYMLSITITNSIQWTYLLMMLTIYTTNCQTVSLIGLTTRQLL